MDYSEGIDFTMPFMNLGITILYKKPTKKVSYICFVFSDFFSMLSIKAKFIYLKYYLIHSYKPQHVAHLPDVGEVMGWILGPN